MSAIKSRQAVSNGPIEVTRGSGCSRTSMGIPEPPEGRSDLTLAVVGSGPIPSAGDLGPQDNSFLLILRWPLNQQRRPSISRQDQYSRVSGLSRHSMMVSAFAVDKTPSRTMASTIAVLSLLRAMLGWVTSRMSGARKLFACSVSNRKSRAAGVSVSVRL